MTSASVALPRRIARRIRPPSAWTVYWALACAIALGFIAYGVAGISMGHPANLIGVAVWSFNYVLDRRDYQAVRRLERMHDARLPPVPRWRWAFLVVLIAFQAYGWLIIGA